LRFATSVVSSLKAERAALGPVNYEEKVVLAVFAATAFLWVFRVDIQFGVATLPGWSRLLPYPDLIDDGTVAIAMASLLFFIPYFQNISYSAPPLLVIL